MSRVDVLEVIVHHLAAFTFTRTFVITGWRAQHLFGLHASETVGHCSFELFAPLDAGVANRRLRGIMRTGEWHGRYVWSVDDTPYCLEGQIVWLADLDCFIAVCRRARRHDALPPGEFVQTWRAGQTMVDTDLNDRKYRSNVRHVSRMTLPRPAGDVLGSETVPTTSPHPTTGRKLQAARELHHLSKAALAKLAGVTRQQIIVWESDEHAISPRNIERLVPHIGGSVDHYLGAALYTDGRVA